MSEVPHSITLVAYSCTRSIGQGFSRVLVPGSSACEYSHRDGVNASTIAPTFAALRYLRALSLDSCTPGVEDTVMQQVS